MPTSANSPVDMTEIIGGINERIKKLESGASSNYLPDPTSALLADLSVTSLSASVNRYIDDVTKTPRASASWIWTNNIASSNDDPTFDQAKKYQIQFSTPTKTSTTWTDVEGVGWARDDLPLNINVTFKVRAVSWSGRIGPVATSTVNTAKDTVPPVQPATPTVTGILKGIKVAWSGLDVALSVMASDFAYCEVHAATTGATFTPSSSTFTGMRMYNQGTVTFQTDDYQTRFVRLVAYDTSGNASVPSTAGSATPVQAVATDLGIALPGDVAFRDEGNLLLDGSFESSLIRADRLANGGIIGAVFFDNTAGLSYHGSWCVRIDGDANPTKQMYLSSNGMSNAFEVPVNIIPNQKLYVAGRIRGIGGNGTASLVIRWTDASGGQTTTTAFTDSSASGAWELFEATIIPPSTAVSMNMRVQTSSHTTGSWYFDAVQLRTIVGTMLIEDAAITNAKIGLLAVNDANIASANVGKLTGGQIAASQYINAGDSTGSHASMDATGFYAYSIDTDGNPILAVRMGTIDNDLFALVNAAGDSVATISDEGVGSFTNLNVDGDPTFMGSPFFGVNGDNKDNVVDYQTVSGRSFDTAPMGLFEAMPQGVIGRSYTSASTLASVVNAAERYHMVNVAADIMPGRSISIRIGQILCNVTNMASTDTNAVAGYIIRYTTDGTDPTTSSPVLFYHYARPPTNGYCTLPYCEHTYDHNGSSVLDLRIGVFLAAENCSVDFSANQFQVRMVDDGPTITNTGTVINSKTGGVPPSTVKTYVKTYQSNGWATYRSINTILRGDANGGGDTGSHVFQGYSSAGSFNGDQRGLWTFPSITGDVGAGTVTKVEAYIYFAHWYNNSGGTALIKVHGYLDNGWPTGSLPSLTTAINVGGWPKPGGKWVTLPSSLYAGFKSGTYRGFGIGPAGSTSTTYYGYANAAAQLRVTYVK